MVKAQFFNNWFIFNKSKGKAISYVEITGKTAIVSYEKEGEYPQLFNKEDASFYCDVLNHNSEELFEIRQVEVKG